MYEPNFEPCLSIKNEELKICPDCEVAHLTGSYKGRMMNTEVRMTNRRCRAKPLYVLIRRLSTVIC
jgi:RNA polymerase subunit RPABC4/transcription elongation factor Spt4